MNKLSTGEDSILQTWRKIAYVFDGFKQGAATDFIDKKIEESPNGEFEEVVADESQLLMLLASISKGYCEEEMSQ